MAKIIIKVEVDTDELFEEANGLGELSRVKFDALVQTPEWQAEAAEVMYQDFLLATEQDASTADEGLFAGAVW